MIFDELKRKINLVKGRIEAKRAKNHCITYKQGYREKCLLVNEELIKQMYEARVNAEIDDSIIDTRNVLAVLNSNLAISVMGDNSFVPKAGKEHINPDDLQEDEMEYSSVISRHGVKTTLEAGADVKGIFYGVYDDDDEDDLVRITINALPKGLRMWPVFFDGETRKEYKIGDLNPVFVDFDQIFEQCYSIGELATIYSYRVEPDVIGMLMRADADFMVRTPENHTGIHALAAAFLPETENSSERKQEVLDAYKKVYLTKENLLSDAQRQIIVDVMKDCVDENCTIAQNISEEDRAMIQDVLNEITHQATKDECIEK